MSNKIMVPSALESLDAIAAAVAGKRVALFLDYDGTLTPIVERPDLAVLSGEMREAVERFAALAPVAIVSGRDRADVESLVQIERIHYAGSHGFDIAGPEGHLKEKSKGEPFVRILREAEKEIREALEGLEGALVESKKYAFAVHYRLVADARVPVLRECVDKVAGRHGALRVKEGKKVYEFLPDFDWDKGKAVRWLLDALRLSGPDVLPFYLGDDRTDEDAFGAIQEDGIGILVADAPQETKARYVLRDVEEVRDFIGHLAGILAGS